MSDLASSAQEHHMHSLQHYVLVTKMYCRNYGYYKHCSGIISLTFLIKILNQERILHYISLYPWLMDHHAECSSNPDSLGWLQWQHCLVQHIANKGLWPGHFVCPSRLYTYGVASAPMMLPTHWDVFLAVILKTLELIRAVCIQGHELVGRNPLLLTFSRGSASRSCYSLYRSLSLTGWLKENWYSLCRAPLFQTAYIMIWNWDEDVCKFCSS